MIQELKIGGHFPQIEGHAEGAYFETDESGALLIYNFANPTTAEINAVNEKQPFEIRFVTYRGILFVLSKCGTLAWCDSPYTPYLSEDIGALKRPEHNGEGLLLTLMMVDARTNEIKHLRAISLGHDFSCSLWDEIGARMTAPFDKNEYFKTINEIYAIKSSKQLAEMANCRFKLRGE